SIDLVKTAAVSGTGTGLVGEVVTYTFVTTNTGNVTLTDIDLDDHTFDGAPSLVIGAPASSDGVSSEASLAPGAWLTYTATYTITQADIDRGTLSNQALATGTPPSGPDVEDESGTSTGTDDPTNVPLDPHAPSIDLV